MVPCGAAVGSLFADSCFSSSGAELLCTSHVPDRAFCRVAAGAAEHACSLSSLMGVCNMLSAMMLQQYYWWACGRCCRDVDNELTGYVA